MSTDPKPLLHSLHSTGTPGGQSGIRQLANGCPRKWYLNKQQEDEGLSEAPALRIGIIGHAFMEMYYRTNDRMLNVTAVKFTNNAVSEDDVCRREAQRIFTAYQAQYAPGEIGEVIGTEVLLPENEDQAAAVDKAIGYKGYTGRLDLVTRNTEEEVERFRKTRAVNLGKPGVYLWDWKFIRSAASTSYEDDLQPMFYQMAWNAAHPDDKAQGMVMVLLTKTKVPQIHHVFVPPPGRAEKAMVRAVTARANRILKTQKPPYETNPDRCFSWGKMCRYLRSGECWRV